MGPSAMVRTLSNMADSFLRDGESRRGSSLLLWLYLSA